ncbi:MAG: hypothetical protein ACFFG0_03745 [Candidatus Thorarchaeota archaeon]
MTKQNISKKVDELIEKIEERIFDKMNENCSHSYILEDDNILQCSHGKTKSNFCMKIFCPLLNEGE